MIAPARTTTETRSSDRDERLHRARRLVAESLLAEDDPSQRSAPAIAPWRSWLVCGWLVLVVVCYVVALLSGRM